jgi:branched-chain amino acid transport system permease protein
MRTGNYKESVAQIIALSDSRAAWAATAALIAALIIAPYLVGTYALTLMVSALIAVIGAVGLNLLTGTTGLIRSGKPVSWRSVPIPMRSCSPTIICRCG